MNSKNKHVGAILSALLAAALYAINIPLSKLLLSSVAAVFMAAFLYLGAGIGMLIMSAAEIVILKGIFSGLGSFIVALISGEKLPDAISIVYVLLLGFVAYGLSIFFYVRAQRYIGAAKTSAYYAVSPFIGAILSLVIMNERLADSYFYALAVMIAGATLAVLDTLAPSKRT